jgi:hypothetical protein
MSQVKRSGPPVNGEVLITGVEGSARFVRSRLAATVRDNGDGTASIVLPPGMKPGDGHFVVWADDDGEHHTACVVPETSKSVEERLTALEQAQPARG